MSTNQNNDYEALAKLLYPSIEASGNVYYGQTRKLTTDNTFGRNELNFDSHIETFKVDGNYESYFNWKIGPLNGAVRIEPLSKVDGNLGDYTKANFPGSDVYEVSLDEYSEEITDPSYVLHGVMFAKYKLNFIDKEVSNNLYSGNFNTYENFVSCSFEYIAVRNYRYMDNYDPYTRSFYIEKEGLYWYLYIQIAFDSTHHITQHELEMPFTIKSISGVTGVAVSDMSSYQKKENNGNWENLTSYYIEISNGGTLSLKIKDSSSDVNAPKITITGSNGSTSEIYGNIHSIKFKDYTNTDYYDISDYTDTLSEVFAVSDSDAEINIAYASKLVLPATTLANSCYSGMFKECNKLKKGPALTATTLALSCYSEMFRGCTSLQVAPNLPATTLAGYCYGYMFYGCTSLQVAPNLPATTLTNYCYACMFYGCTSLSTVAVAATWDTSAYTENWLQDAGTNSATKTIWCDATYTDYPTDASGMPFDWNKQSYSDYVESVETGYKGFCDRLAITRNNRKVPFVISSGSDSEFNGRGLLNNSNKFNMEGSFDENNTHKMDTYNNDGSYNQEIWGYKSFNSPVKFRNGIYGECGSFVTSDESLRGFSQNGISLYSNTLHIGNNTSYKPHSAININSGYENNFFVTLNTIYSTNNKDTCNAGYDYTSGDEVPDGPNFNNCASVYTASYDVGSEKCNISCLVTDFDSSNASITVKTDFHDSNNIISSIELKVDNTNSVSLNKDNTNINKSIIPNSDSDINLGDADYRFDNVYANKFHGNLNGIIPTPIYNNNTTITDGCIFLAGLTNGSATEHHVGEVITFTGISTTGINIYFVQSYYNSNVSKLLWDDVTVVPEGKYKLLSGIKFDGDVSHQVIALVIKV